MLVGGISARAEPRLYSQETKQFRIVYYSPQDEYLSPLLIRSLENAAQFYREKLGYQPKGQITILIQDFDHLDTEAPEPSPSTSLKSALSNSIWSLKRSLSRAHGVDVEA